MEALSRNPFERSCVIDLDSVCLEQFSRLTNPSTLDLKLHRGEGSSVSSSAGSESARLDTTESIFGHDGASRVTEQTGVITFADNDGVYGGLPRDGMLSFDKQDQYMGELSSPNRMCSGNVAPAFGFNEHTFCDGNVVETPPGSNGAGTDKDPGTTQLEQSVGPGRRYQKLTANGEQMQGPGAGGISGTQPNDAPIMNLFYTPRRRPEEGNSDAKNLIQRGEKSGLLQYSTAGSHRQKFDTLLHCRRPAAASGSFMAAVSKLMPLSSMFLAGIHESEPGAIDMLVRALDEQELAIPGVLCPAMDLEAAADLRTTEDKSSSTETYWRASPSPSSVTRDTRLDEFPRRTIQRLMPPGGTIYFGMDIHSFDLQGIDSDLMVGIRDAAIKAAKYIEEKNLGIAFAFTTDPRYNVFNICYDASIPPSTLARAFFPSERPDYWRLCVSSLASDRLVFVRHKAHITKIFCHEFAHILGLRHCDAGFNVDELLERSFLWPDTLDGDCNTIMCTGMHPKDLEFSDEDIWVIREFYSKRNGAVVNGVRIMDVNPYKTRWDFFVSQVDARIALNHY